MNTAVAAATPFDLIGGTDVVRRVVERFYDLTEQDPQFAQLRALHATDLAPMRESLTGFLTAWLGGPRHWFEQRPGACIMSAHAGIAITAETADQWRDAMDRALLDAGIDADLCARIIEAFARMAGGMARR